MQPQYKVILSPEFRKEFKKLPSNIQERVRKILSRLEYMLIGEALKYDLKGFYSVHFENNRYRLIYAKEDAMIEVLALHVGKRTGDFYKKFSEELKARKKLVQS